jgi:hypothetical protein
MSKRKGRLEPPQDPELTAFVRGGVFDRPPFVRGGVFDYPRMWFSPLTKGGIA